MYNAKKFFRFSSLVCLPLLAPALLRAQEKEPIKYIGPGSCAATSCHGSVKVIAGSRILQNEYSTWILQDRHSRAYQALTGDVGERMARILKLGAKAEEAPKCLACNALYTTPEQRGRAFEISARVGAREARRRCGLGRRARVGCRAGGTTARFDGTAVVAREKRALRQEGYLAGILRTFLFRVPPRAGAGKGQLAARAWLRGTAAR